MNSAVNSMVRTLHMRDSAPMLATAEGVSLCLPVLEKSCCLKYTLGRCRVRFEPISTCTRPVDVQDSSQHIGREAWRGRTSGSANVVEFVPRTSGVTMSIYPTDPRCFGGSWRPRMLLREWRLCSLAAASRRHEARR
mgnify:CR=1 FL=1